MLTRTRTFLRRRTAARREVMTSTRTGSERSRLRAAWMAAAQSGDLDAYRTLLDDVRPLVRGFLRARVSDPDDAADALQETLINLHRARHTYDPSRPFEPWLLAIARHVAVDHVRRRVARSSREVLVDEMPSQSVAAPGLGFDLARALRSLTPTQRQALELLAIEGLSVEAAAVRARTTPGALKVRAHRAGKVLRSALAS
jgi:RNA polymerase sigma-70 factor (ECF subfamily)